MKKQFILFSFLALFSLLFISCQSSDNITSPGTNLDKPVPPPIYTYGCNPTAISAGGTATVDLIAGQHNPVGTATFTLTAGGDLNISYTLYGGVGVITEVHIDFATDLDNDAAHGGFHANSQGSPTPGQFDLNTTSGASYWNTTISKATLLNYLNSAGPNVPSHFYIAAHGVVSYESTGGAGICPDLPNGKYRWGGIINEPGSNYYFRGGLYNEPNFNTPLDTLNGWCVDRSRGGRPLQFTQVDFLCSTENLSGLCLLDKPANIGAVNWLLNNKGSATMIEIQIAIWTLIDDNNDFTTYFYDPNVVNALVTAALQHTSFVPDCGQIIGVLMFSTGQDYCSPGGLQVMLVEKTVECGGGGSDTMWGFDWDFENGIPVDDNSCRFVEQGNWARYFQF